MLVKTVPLLSPSTVNRGGIVSVVANGLVRMPERSIGSTKVGGKGFLGDSTRLGVMSATFAGMSGTQAGLRGRQILRISTPISGGVCAMKATCLNAAPKSFVPKSPGSAIGLPSVAM